MNVTVWSSTTATSRWLLMCDVLFGSDVKSEWQRLMCCRMSCDVDSPDPQPSLAFSQLFLALLGKCASNNIAKVQMQNEFLGFFFHLCDTRWTLVSQFWWIILFFYVVWTETIPVFVDKRRVDHDCRRRWKWFSKKQLWINVLFFSLGDSTQLE